MPSYQSRIYASNQEEKDASIAFLHPNPPKDGLSSGSGLSPRHMALDIQHQHLRDLPPFHSTPIMDDRPSLPPIGLDISRPPSTSSQASSQFNYRRPSPNPHAHLPGLSQLSALASAATSTSPDSNHSKGSHGHFQNYIQRARSENVQESGQAVGRLVHSHFRPARAQGRL